MPNRHARVLIYQDSWLVGKIPNFKMLRIYRNRLVWSVNAAIATMFTEDLYMQLKEGTLVGEAIKRSCVRCKKLRDLHG
jgi:hypothetical protein